jgi:chaperone required for assembly of F1-ATPase
MKRFYKAAAAAPCGDGWQVMLDGRGVKTQGGRAQIVPTLPLAEAMAAEWADQGEEIDPKTFVLRDMADYAIDVVAGDRDAAITALMPYAETDTLCYRAEPGQPLLKRQEATWEPFLAAAEQRWGVTFERVAGIIHRAQPPATLQCLRDLLCEKDDFTLAALRSMAGLAASMTIALGALEPGAEAEALWALANLEEDFQTEMWGQDAEAMALRARRFRDFSAAMRFAALLG